MNGYYYNLFSKIFKLTGKTLLSSELDEVINAYNLDIKEKIMEGKASKQEIYDFINPDHYKSSSSSKEVIDMMIDIWGIEAVMLHCEITAFKYRMRIGKKPGQSIENELNKALWYENKAKELRNRLNK